MGRFAGAVFGALVAAATAGAAASQESPGDVAARIDGIVRAAMERDHLKAVLAGVSSGGSQQTWAWGESMTGVAATPDMRFRNGAVAIAYIGTVLLQLKDAGALALDATLDEWFPDYPAADQVTLEMLMNGTSGYADYVTDEAFVKALYADPFRHWSAEEKIAIGLAREAVCAPGACWSYAHTNFVILGEVLEKVTGKGLDVLIREGIIEPLGLEGTVSDMTARIPEPVLHAFDAERGTYEESTFWNPSWTLADGSVMTTTVADVLTSAAAIGEGTLVSPESHERQLGPATATFPPWNERMWYGLGVFVINGWVLQNPSFAGYAATMAYHPRRNLGIVVSVTLDPEASPDGNPSTELLKEIATALAPDAPL